MATMHNGGSPGYVVATKSAWAAIRYLPLRPRAVAILSVGNPLAVVTSTVVTKCTCACCALDQR